MEAIKEKSVKIPKETLRKFSQWINTCNSTTHAVELCDINRQTITKILNAANPSCSPETLEKIERVINL